MFSLGGCPDVQTAYQDSVALARQQETQREQHMEVSARALILCPPSGRTVEKVAEYQT